MGRKKDAAKVEETLEDKIISILRCEIETLRDMKPMDIDKFEDMVEDLILAKMAKSLERIVFSLRHGKQ